MSDPDNTSGSDRRQHARAPLELKVEYTRLNAFFADYTKNISKGGTFIRTTQPLAPGTEFVFTLRIPSVEQPLSLRGEVVRVVSPEEAASTPGTDPGMGIRFLFASEEERRGIEIAAERLMKDSLGDHNYNRLLREQERSKK